MQARSFATLKRGIRIAPRWHVQPNAEQMGQVGDLLVEGTVRVEFARTVALGEARDSYRFVHDDHPRGKVVLTLD